MEGGMTQEERSWWRIPAEAVRASTFLQVLGFVYFIAFTSFGVQAAGLIGQHGILPYANYLRAVREQLGSSAFWEVPTLFWINSGDAALRAAWMVGALGALAAIFTPWRRTALAVCLVLWLSICNIGQDFLSFQWDVLLVEVGFLAIFADESPVRVWLFRWLIFRLMFFSGVVKLGSGGPAWRNLTALDYHYYTQPLPTPLAWFMAQLPLWFQKASTAAALAVELAVPFSFFGPRRVRLAGAWLTAGLQVLILATGNYTFFNFLTIALCMWLVIEPRRTSEPTPRRHRVVSAALAAFIAMISMMLFLMLFRWPLPAGGREALEAVDPFHLVNSYGLFAVMTTERQEIIVEGSSDGIDWKAYEFRYKPGNPLRAPPVIEPAQPRLDWQMWFAALGSYRQNRWFANFMIRLLQGEPAVTGLLQYNPFPNAAPKFVRARLFVYRFTRFGERGWWTREERGDYFPVVGLR
jgi:hypothetical protein